MKEVLVDLRTRLNEFMENTNDPLLSGEIPIDQSWKVNKKECTLASSKNEEDYVSMGNGMS